MTPDITRLIARVRTDLSALNAALLCQDDALSGTRLVFEFAPLEVDRLCLATHCLVTPLPCRHGYTWWCPSVREQKGRKAAPEVKSHVDD